MVMPKESSFWSLLDRTLERCVQKKMQHFSLVLYIRVLDIGVAVLSY